MKIRNFIYIHNLYWGMFNKRIMFRLSISINGGGFSRRLSFQFKYNFTVVPYIAIVLPIQVRYIILLVKKLCSSLEMK